MNFIYAFKCYHYQYQQKCKLASLQLVHPVFQMHGYTVTVVQQVNYNDRDDSKLRERSNKKRAALWWGT